MGSKRAPLFAGLGVAVLGVLLVAFFVLPKMGQVSEAKTQLSEIASQEQTLLSRQQALEDARAAAPAAKATIAEVDQMIPPTVDEAGMLLLLNNAAGAAGLDLASLAPGTPALDATTGLSSISVAMSAEGTYFDVTEFMYRIETLPRAAKVTALQLAPGETTGGGIPTLSATITLVLYTSDTSAGPGSIPGATTGTTPVATTGTTTDTTTTDTTGGA